MKISVNVLVPAPIDKVWSAYTTPEDIMQWNAASDDWHTTASSVDLRPGGAFSSRMEAKDGSFGFDFDQVFVPDEIGANHRIGGLDGFESLPVGSSDGFPVLDMADKNPRSDHIFKFSTQRLEGAFEFVEDEMCLSGRIISSH